jgi:hypothetical protein
VSNHTPGPWTARRMACQTDSHTFNSEAVTTGGECVASLLRKADAQLIAAAPELLAACEVLVEAMHDYEWSVDDSPTPKHRAMMIAAIAAIKKARGD